MTPPVAGREPAAPAPQVAAPAAGPASTTPTGAGTCAVAAAAAGAATPDPSAPPGAASAWLAATRPATLPLALVPIVVGTALARAHGNADLDLALRALGTAALLQVGTNLHNDLADARRGADGPGRLGPARATARGWLAPRAVGRAAALCFALGAALGLSLVAAGGWPFLALGLLCLACAAGYTGGPWPLAYHGLGEAAVAACFGGVGVAGTYALQAGRVHVDAAPAALAVGALCAAVLVVNNLRDRAGDAAVGKRTLAVRLGARGARLEYALLVALAYAAVAYAALAPLAAGAPARWGWLAPLATLPWALALARAVSRRDGRDLNPLLGATARLALAFGVTLSGGLLA